MGSVKFNGFEANKLLREIKKGFEKYLKKDPGKVLDSHIGDIVEAK